MDAVPNAVENRAGSAFSESGFGNVTLSNSGDSHQS